MNLILLFSPNVCHSWVLVSYMCFVIQDSGLIFLGIVFGEAWAEGQFLQAGCVFTSARFLEALFAGTNK